MAKLTIRDINPCEFDETTTFEERMYNRFHHSVNESVLELEKGYQTKSNLIKEIWARREMVDYNGWNFKVLRAKGHQVLFSFTYTKLSEPDKRWIHVFKADGGTCNILIMTECE